MGSESNTGEEDNASTQTEEEVDYYAESNDEVAAFASRLAPQVKELDELLSSSFAQPAGGGILSSSSSPAAMVHNPSPIRIPQQNDNHDIDDSDNFSMDSMDRELNDLAVAQQSLQEELDLAQEFASFFGTNEENDNHPTTVTIGEDMDEGEGEGEDEDEFDGTKIFKISTPSLDYNDPPSSQQQQQQQPHSEAVMIPKLDVDLPLQQHETDTTVEEEQLTNAMEMISETTTLTATIAAAAAGTAAPTTAPTTTTNATISLPKGQDLLSQQSESTERYRNNQAIIPNSSLSPSPNFLSPFFYNRVVGGGAPAATATTTSTPSKDTKKDGTQTKTQTTPSTNTVPSTTQPTSTSLTTPPPPGAPVTTIMDINNVMFVLRTPNTKGIRATAIPKPYTFNFHKQAVKIQKEPRGAWYSIDLTSHVLPNYGMVPNATTNETKTKKRLRDSSQDGIIKEYCIAINDCQRWYHGMTHIPTTTTADDNAKDTNTKDTPSQVTGNSTTTMQENNEATPTPVRTIAIRIRPDVLCGAVMDSIHNVVEDMGLSDVRKRQGGHLQGCVYAGTTASAATATTTVDPTFTNHSCAFDFDSQLCTNSSSKCERMVLLRIYHPSQQTIHESNQVEKVTTFASSTTTTKTANDASTTTKEEDKFKDHRHNANLHLREACALIQRIESPHWAKKGKPIHIPKDFEELYAAESAKEEVTDDSESERMRKRDFLENYMTYAQPYISSHLLTNYRACPSVLDIAASSSTNSTNDNTTNNNNNNNNNKSNSKITLPSLSPIDWPVICSSWELIHNIFKELHERQLTFAAYETAQFGIFPSLPTLDVQYCSQLKTYSRKLMITNLLKHATDLEQYASQQEINAYHGWTLLQSATELYDMKEEDNNKNNNKNNRLPKKPVYQSLAAYPLNFVSHQAVCPPWGNKVMEAMNLVVAMSRSNQYDNSNDDDDDNADNKQKKKEKKSSSDPMNNIIVSSSYEDEDENDDNDNDNNSIFGEDEGDDEDKASHKEQEKFYYTSFNMAEKAVDLVWDAFQKQHDEEQSARLDRKNRQVMDRLLKMQEYQRAVIQAISHCNITTNNPEAIKAANDFYNKSSKLENLTNVSHRPMKQRNTNTSVSLSSDVNYHKEVPLLSFSIMVGSTTGHCYVTKSQILLTTTKWIPLLGSAHSTLFYIKDIELQLVEETSYMFQALGTTMVSIIKIPKSKDDDDEEDESTNFLTEEDFGNAETGDNDDKNTTDTNNNNKSDVKKKEVVYTFRPSWISASRLKSFVDTLRELKCWKATNFNFDDINNSANNNDDNNK